MEKLADKWTWPPNNRTPGNQQKNSYSSCSGKNQRALFLVLAETWVGFWLDGPDLLRQPEEGGHHWTLSRWPSLVLCSMLLFLRLIAEHVPFPVFSKCKTLLLFALVSTNSLFRTERTTSRRRLSTPSHVATLHKDHWSSLVPHTSLPALQFTL